MPLQRFKCSCILSSLHCSGSFPLKDKDIVQFEKVQERATSMFKRSKQGVFGQLCLGVLNLKGGNRITAEVYKIMNVMKKLPVSDQHYSTLMISSNTIPAIYSSVYSDILTPFHYTSIDK